jgi:glutamine amidotransferase-like uncharacterized protein
VYRGRSRTDRLCADAVARLLEASPWHFTVDFAGPRGTRPLSADVLRGAALYAQPGGGTLGKAYRRLRSRREDVRAYVSSGGRYLGVCLGGYLAGATPGFDLLPGDTDRYIDLSGATVTGDGEAVVPVLWRGRRREMYFQDGPHFVLDQGGDGDDGTEVLARYTNGAVAALVTPFGRGRVGVTGPHPEATADWFEQLPAVDGTDLAHDLLDTLMRA